MARTTITRLRTKASQDRSELDRLLDSVRIGHFALVAGDGQPVVLPTAVVRDGDRMLAHGSTGSGWIRRLAAGAPASPAVNELPELACGQLLQLMHAHAHDRSIHHGRRTRGVTSSPAIHIVPICTPQPVNAEIPTTAIGRFPITLGSRCVTTTKWSSQ
jgi:hypothetical protein